MTRRLQQAFGGLFGEFLGIGTSTVLDRASRLITSLVAAAFIGPADWGVWFIVNLVIVYGSLTHLGSPNGMTLEVPSALGRDDQDGADQLQGVSATVLVLSLAATWVVLGTAAILGIADPISPRVLLATGLLLSGHQMFSFTAMVFRARIRFNSLARLHFVSALSLPILVIPATYAGHLEGFIISQAIHYVLLAGVAILFQDVRIRFRFDRCLARRTIEVGFPIMLVGVVFALFSTVDRWVVVGVLGTESLGYYSLSILGLGVMGLLPKIVAQQIYPRMAFAWSSKRDPSELIHLANLQRRFALFAALPVSASVAAVAPWAIHAFLPAYAPGIPALLVTIAIPVLYTFGQGYGNVFNVIGRRMQYLALVALATVVNAITSLALVGAFGLVGVAMGTLTGFVWLAVSLIVLGRRTVRPEVLGDR